MKKYFLALLSISFTIILAACGKNLDNIPSFSVMEEQGEEWATEKLNGYTKDNLREVWGEPDKMASGINSEAWNVENDNDQVVVFYDEKDKVEEVKYIYVFKGTVLEVRDSSILVEPFEDEWERNSADQIDVGIGSLEMKEETKAELKEGEEVLVGYNGAIAETYPAQLEAVYVAHLAEQEN